MVRAQSGPRGPRREGRGRFIPRRRVCAFCVEKIDNIDYKDAQKLSRFISDRGKIEPRRRTGTCAWHQRRLALALKRARHLALLPFTQEHIRITGGPFLTTSASIAAATAALQRPTPEAPVEVADLADVAEPSSTVMAQEAIDSASEARVVEVT